MNKLINSNTGEIVVYGEGIIDLKSFGCKNVAEFLEAGWEDYKEPKVGYLIDPMEEDCVSADDDCYEEADIERAKELGIWFETREEAEKAVKKLKAWKRLKDAGCGLKLDDHFAVRFVGPDARKITTAEEQKSLSDAYKLLFGGEDE